MEMNQIRDNIDKIDNEILDRIRKRFELAKQIGKGKQEKNMKIKDSKREEQIISRLIQSNKDIDAGFIAELYDLILSESRKIQEEK